MQLDHISSKIWGLFDYYLVISFCVFFLYSSLCEISIIQILDINLFYKFCGLSSSDFFF